MIQCTEQGRAGTIPKSGDRVAQGPDPGNRDLDDVAVREREVVGRDDAGSGQEDRSVGELLLATEVGDQLFKAALHPGDRGRALEGDGAAAAYHELDPEGARVIDRSGQEQRRAER